MTDRSDDAIRADLATEEGRGSAERQSPTGRLVADVAPLLARAVAAEARAETLRVENKRLAGINRDLVRDYNHMLRFVEPPVIRDAHDFWCDEPKCSGPCNCGRTARIAQDERLAEARARVTAVETDLGERQRWIDEAVLALDAASVIGQRSCREGDGLHYANHDRLIIEAREWSGYARHSTHSIPPLPLAAASPPEEPKP